MHMNKNNLKQLWISFLIIPQLTPSCTQTLTFTWDLQSVVPSSFIILFYSHIPPFLFIWLTFYYYNHLLAYTFNSLPLSGFVVLTSCLLWPCAAKNGWKNTHKQVEWPHLKPMTTNRKRASRWPQSVYIFLIHSLFCLSVESVVLNLWRTLEMLELFLVVTTWRRPCYWHLVDRNEEWC